jgi:MarR family transcriptional regulator, organic hydroperoxide resistance regulator
MSYRKIWAEINKLLQKVESKYAKSNCMQFGTQSLTVSQVGILLLLDKKGTMKISDIAEELTMINSNVSNICDRLEKAGLVVRNRLKDDQRVVNIELTDNARDKMDGIKALVNNFYKKVQENVSQKDIEDIYTGLVKLNKLFDMFSDFP